MSLDQLWEKKNHDGHVCSGLLFQLFRLLTLRKSGLSYCHQADTGSCAWLFCDLAALFQ